MRRHLLAVTLAATCVLSACEGTVTGEDAGVFVIPKSDGGMSAVTGVVTYGPCSGLEGISVRQLDATSGAVLSDATGAFTLPNGLSYGSLEGSADGYTSTITGYRNWATAVNRQIVMWPSATLLKRNSFANVTMDAAKGTVYLAVMDSAFQTIGGVTVELFASNGKPAEAVRRYVHEYALDPEATSVGVGNVVFFNVPAGEYRAVFTRNGDTYPELFLPVRAGKSTIDYVIRTSGEGGTTPVILEGDVYARPKSNPSAEMEPMPDAGVTLYLGPNTPAMETTTDGAGHYRFTINRRRLEIDLTYTADGYLPERSSIGCIGASRYYDVIRLENKDALLYNLLMARGSKPWSNATGNVLFAVMDRTDPNNSVWGWPVDGATVSVQPSTGPLFYNSLPSVQESSCAVSSCATQTCAAGTRCQAGECVLDTSPNLCSRCGTGNTCAPGLYSKMLVDFSGASACYCLPPVTDCFAADTSCPDGTFCAYSLGPEPSMCLPKPPDGTATQPFPGRKDYAELGIAADLAPGTYKFTGHYKALTPQPIRVRISGGVLNRIWLGVE